MVVDFSCPPGASPRRAGAGSTPNLMPSGASARDIIDIVVTIKVSSTPQSIRYILTDRVGNKFYSAYITTVPTPNQVSQDWFELSFGLPTQVLAPPQLFTTDIIERKNVPLSVLQGALTQDQLNLAASLNGISRLSYAQFYLGSPITKYPNADEVTDIEFESQGTALGTPTYEMGRIVAKVTYSGSSGSGVGEIVIDDFDAPSNATSSSVGSSVGGIRRVVANRQGTDASTGGLLYTTLRYNPINDEFITINTEGSGRISRARSSGFTDLAAGFGGSLQREAVAVHPSANFAYVVDGAKGSVYKLDLSTGLKQVIADNLNKNAPTVVFPVAECDVSGNLITLIGAQWYRVSPVGGVEPLGTDGSGVSASINSLTRVGNEYFVAHNATISKVDLTNAALTPAVTFASNVHGVVTQPVQSLLYAVERDVSTHPNAAGTRILRIDQVSGATTVVYTSPSGYFIYGIAFGKSSSGPEPALYALLSTITHSDQGTAVNAQVVEVNQVTPVQSGTQQTDSNGSAPHGWTACGTGGALLGQSGDVNDVSGASRFVLSKIPPGSGCQMFYKQVAWYERGWRINACCGALVEFNGIQWLVVKRSIGIDTSCGGGESESTQCIEQYVVSGQGHPAIAWPTVDGEEFLGLPSSGFVTFVKDDALSAALLDRIENNKALLTKGDPVAQIPFIIFPAA